MFRRGGGPLKMKIEVNFLSFCLPSATLWLSMFGFAFTLKLKSNFHAWSAWECRRSEWGIIFILTDNQRFIFVFENLNQSMKTLSNHSSSQRDCLLIDDDWFSPVLIATKENNQQVDNESMKENSKFTNVPAPCASALELILEFVVQRWGNDVEIERVILLIDIRQKLPIEHCKQVL